MASSQRSKQEHELSIFSRFVQRLGRQTEWREVSSRPEPEPDLRCVHLRDGVIAFELVSLTDPNIARLEASGEEVGEDDSSSADPSVRIVWNKLHKKYQTDAQCIELLIYTDGQITTADEVIIPSILPLFDQYAHPFSRVWFMGEQLTCCLWPSQALKAAE